MDTHKYLGILSSLFNVKLLLYNSIIDATTLHSIWPYDSGLRVWVINEEGGGVLDGLKFHKC